MKIQFRIIEETKDFGEKRFWYIESRTKEWTGWSTWRCVLDTYCDNRYWVNYKLQFLIENGTATPKTYGEIHTVTEQKTKGDKVRDMFLFLLCCVIMYTFIYVCVNL